MKAGLILLAGAVTLSSVSLYADWRSSDAGLSDYEKWKSTTQQEFRNYLDENDKAFIGFLKQRWEPVSTEDGKPEDVAPKPVAIPEAPPATAPEPVTETKPVRDSEAVPVVTVPVPTPSRIPSDPVSPPVGIPTTTPQGLTVDVSFYGHPLSLPFTPAMTRAFTDRPSSDNIAAAWEKLARSDFKPVVSQIKSIQSTLALSDWASARLVTDYADEVGRDLNSQTMLSWFLLVKLGYDARLAYNDRLYLLMPADDDVYGVTYFTLSGQRYYALPLNGDVRVAGQVYTYGKQHETASEPLRFKTPEHFRPAGANERRILSFNNDGDRVELSVSYPQEQIHYLDSMPQLNLPRYPMLDLPDQTRAELSRQLKPLLDGHSEEVAVNRLLNFVQNAFEYQTDEQQFQKENYLYPLETLHYAASDCEDRAALFSLLVHDLLGLPVVLLDYPGHVAAAVGFTGEVNGDTLVYNGQRYTVTDPTYINARAGMTMPEFASQSPDIVEIF